MSIEIAGAGASDTVGKTSGSGSEVRTIETTDTPASSTSTCCLRHNGFRENVRWASERMRSGLRGVSRAMSYNRWCPRSQLPSLAQRRGQAGSGRDWRKFCGRRAADACFVR